MPQPQVVVQGLKELRRDLKRAEQVGDTREFRNGLKAAADVVARDAKNRIVSRTGRARGAVRAVAGGNKAFVVGGKARVPYYGWLDFGGRRPQEGNPRSVGPWAGSGRGPKRGRFIYPAFDAKSRRTAALVRTAVDKALKQLDL